MPTLVVGFFFYEFTYDYATLIAPTILITVNSQGRLAQRNRPNNFKHHQFLARMAGHPTHNNMRREKNFTYHPSLLRRLPYLKNVYVHAEIFVLIISR